VGCGTGVITADLRARISAHAFGVDIDPGLARYAARKSPGPCYLAGDGGQLPFRASCFDAVVTHFLLLWVRDPLAILKEAMRVAHPGGWVLCLAEPDHGGRLDHPTVLANLGRLQTHALERQGANPLVGRRLRELLHDAGLTNVTAGVMGGEWEETAGPDPDLEWETLRADLRGLATEDELGRWREAELEARERGSRVLFVPTFYGYGRKPAD
jgi:SAM-dependent methyltransferase